MLDGHFFTLYYCKNCNVCLNRLKINETEVSNGPFLLRISNIKVTCVQSRCCFRFHTNVHQQKHEISPCKWYSLPYILSCFTYQTSHLLTLTTQKDIVGDNFFLFQSHKNKKWSFGRAPWSSGYGRRPMFWRLWIRIPVPYTGWTFFTYIFCKVVMMFAWKYKNKP